MHSVTHWVYLSTAVDLGETQNGDEAVSNILLESLTHVKPWQVGVRGVSLLANGFLADGLIVGIAIFLLARCLVANHVCMVALESLGSLGSKMDYDCCTNDMLFGCRW